MRKSQAAALVQGRRILCLYHGEDLWHERLLLKAADASGFVWVIVTPDCDVYWEDYRKSEDIKDIRLVPLAGGRPAGVTGKIYPFTFVPSPTQLADWRKEAVAVFNSIPVSVPVIADADAVADGDSAPMKARKGKVRPGEGGLSADDDEEHLRGSVVQKAPAPSGQRWYTSAPSSCGTLEAGVLLVDNYESCLVSDGQGLFILKGGSVYGELVKVTKSDAVGERRRKVVEYLLALEGGEEWAKVDKAETPRKAADEKADAVELDARVLPVSKRLGRRHRAWDSVAADSTEIPMESWPVDGPRAALWVIMFLARFVGGGPEAYHRWWRSITRLTMADWGVAEHSQICRYLSLAGEYDQLDMGNLAVVEAICRRLQLIEYQYRERSREATRGGAQGGSASSALTGLTVMSGGEADLFDGIGAADNSVCVAPKLVEWIAAELQKTAAIDKAARKAREERSLAKTTVSLEQPPLLANLPPTADKADKAGKGGGKKE